MVKLKLQEHELLLWHERTSQPEFDRFKRIHNTYRVNYFWKISKQNPKLLTACKSVVRIISCFVSSNVHTDVCSKCSKGYTNIVDHCISECVYIYVVKEFCFGTRFINVVLTYTSTCGVLIKSLCLV